MVNHVQIVLHFQYSLDIIGYNGIHWTSILLNRGRSNKVGACKLTVVSVSSLGLIL